MDFNILNVTRNNIISDRSIVNAEFHSHKPYSSTTYNNNDEIKIPIQHQNLLTLPSNSHLYIQGKLLGADDKPSKTLSLTNNGILFLFSEIRYEIGGQIIDRVRNPGITSCIKNAVSLTNAAKRYYYNAGFSFQNAKFPTEEDGSFNFCIPLSMILGFAEDYKKIMVNLHQELVLTRSNSDLNTIHTSGADTTGKIVITELSWEVPHIIPSDVQRLQLLKLIEIEKDLNIHFRSWELHEYPILQETMKHTWAIKTTSQVDKPSFIIVALQTDRKAQIKKDASVFDHCDIQDIELHLNSERYPYKNLNLDIDKGNYSKLYRMFAHFYCSYYNKTEPETCYLPKEFIKNAPLFVIDCSKQPETLRSGSVDVQLEFVTKKNIPAKTTAYCLILYDRKIVYNPLESTVKIA